MKISNLSHYASVVNGMIQVTLPRPTQDSGPGKWLGLLSEPLPPCSLLSHLAVNLTLYTIRLWLSCQWLRRSQYSLFHHKEEHLTLGKIFPLFVKEKTIQSATKKRSVVHLLGAQPCGRQAEGYKEVQGMALPSWDFQLRCGQKCAGKTITHRAEPCEKNVNYTVQAISAKGVVTKRWVPTAA